MGLGHWDPLSLLMAILIDGDHGVEIESLKRAGVNNLEPCSELTAQLQCFAVIDLGVT